MRDELSEVTALTDAAGIDVLAFKGPLLAAIYPESAPRDFADLDLLVRPNDVDAIDALLRARGYAREPLLDRRRDRAFRRIHFAYLYRLRFVGSSILSPELRHIRMVALPRPLAFLYMPLKILHDYVALPVWLRLPARLRRWVQRVVPPTLGGSSGPKRVHRSRARFARCRCRRANSRTTSRGPSPRRPAAR